MKIIQSFWSNPSFHQNQSYDNARKFGGWLSFKYFLFSNCFSCLSIRRFYKDVVFYTDDRGYDLFIDDLGLPYSDVNKSLNVLKEEDHRLWILGKVLAIRDQSAPFLHIDNDVYLWDRLPEKKSNEWILAQSSLLMPGIYKKNLSEVVENFKDIPSCLLQSINEETTIANVGVIGGNNIEFFQEFSKTSLDFLARNRSLLEKVNVGGFNQIMEEFLITCLAREKKIDIDYFIDSAQEVQPLESVLRFNLTPIHDKYIHLVGVAKQIKESCDQLELRLELEFPEYYKKVSRLMKDRYPLLEDNALQDKSNRLDTLHTLYKLSWEDFLRLKLSLHARLRIVVDGQGKDEGYVLIDDEQNSSIKLTGLDVFLTLFTDPISIEEFLEEVRGLGDLSDEEFYSYKFKMIDFVTNKMVIDNLLQLAG